MPLVLSEGARRGLPLTTLVDVLAAGPARAFGLYPRKGALAVGSDADIIVWDPRAGQTVVAAELHDGLGRSPYEGMSIDGTVQLTVLSGRRGRARRRARSRRPRGDVRGSGSLAMMRRGHGPHGVRPRVARPPVAAPLARAPGSPMILGSLFLGGVFINTCAASINTHVFIWAAPIAVAWMRQIVAGIMLTVIAIASRERVPGASSTWGWALLWGAALALNTGAFYLAVDRIPIGVATTLSFVGPVTVAAFGSHRQARSRMGGVCGGRRAGDRPAGADGYDPLGILIGLSSGLGWAVLILAGSRVVRSWGPTLGAATATVWAALVLAPFALLAGGFPITNPRATGILLVTATVGGALPYTIDMRVMQRLAPATFSVLQSLFPAVGVLVGLLALGQVPGVLELIGVTAVSVASVGALRAAARAHRLDLDEAAGSVPLA